MTAHDRGTKFDAVNRGWISISAPWHLLTTNSGAGNPHAATAEKGRAMMKLLVERLAQFLVDLSAAPLDERFPVLKEEVECRKSNVERKQNEQMTNDAGTVIRLLPSSFRPLGI